MSVRSRNQQASKNWKRKNSLTEMKDKEQGAVATKSGCQEKLRFTARGNEDNQRDQKNKGERKGEDEKKTKRKHSPRKASEGTGQGKREGYAAKRSTKKVKPSKMESGRTKRKSTVRFPEQGTKEKLPRRKKKGNTSGRELRKKKLRNNGQRTTTGRTA